MAACSCPVVAPRLANRFLEASQRPPRQAMLPTPTRKSTFVVLNKVNRSEHATSLCQVVQYEAYDPVRCGPAGLAVPFSHAYGKIDAVGIKNEHTIVEFLGSRRLVLKPYEVLNVAARFLAIERAVSDDNRTRIERFDFID